jgi:hypothetical protein
MSGRLRRGALFGLVLVFMAAFLAEHVNDIASSADTDRPNPTLSRQSSLLSIRHVGRILFAPVFPRGERLITNDFAYFNPADPRASRSRDWKATSGSLFARNGVGWTGIPDATRPNADSSNGTGSAIFRLVTRRRDFANITVSVDLLNQGYVTTPRTPAHAWDGIHLFLHYRSQHSLYALTLNRRDNTVVLKKKQPGGAANGGTYYTLGRPTPYRPPHHHWQHILATIDTTPENTVTITLTIDDTPLLNETDTGAASPALTKPGAIGLRGDNTQFRFKHLLVRAH